MVISKQTFPFYGIIILISLTIGLFYIFRMLKKEGIKDKNIYLYILLYGSFAFIFGKLYTMVSSNEYNLLKAGLSSYGGLIGVILATIIFELILPTNKKLIKYSIISLPLTYGIAKIGCFIAGCCYGIPYNGLFNVVYKDGLNIPLFPIQITETIVFIIIFIICNKLRNNKNIIYITSCISIIAKFLLDFLRYEHINKIISSNQIFSIIILLVLIIIFIINKNKKKTR
jgi:prolipoprotein diacylglyceryltransferase